ncbi:MAG: C4-type zinc ribbon domain-containing protein [Tenuifilum sp.]|uniref:zinc ribbon domain-containing protein n=3 Tax=Tenuifilum sp. TaxID=2760880 RepID=UPI003C932BAE
MAKEKIKPADQGIELSIEEKLRFLYKLQQVDSKIDKIKLLRGELPLEVQDLEDEIVGLTTRIDNYKKEIQDLETQINQKKIEIKDAEALIKKYQEQQKNVRNNREYDSLTKEIEYQTLEIELCNKRIKEYTQQIKDKKQLVEQTEKTVEERTHDLNGKKQELENITQETQKEEDELYRLSEEYAMNIEPRLLTAYKRIRGNARNGLAVVTVQRDACGGCFNKIPPQRQLDIKMHKKVIVCEYCGRILVDDSLLD